VTIESIERTNFMFSVGAIALSMAVATPLFASSVAAGALLEAVNLRGLVRIARRFFAGSGALGSGTWVSIYALRFVWLAVGIGAAIYLGADPLGLILGLSMVVPAAIFEGWRRRGPASAEANALDASDPEWDRWNPWLARERGEIEGDDE
jgi:hypothetical protein